MEMEERVGIAGVESEQPLGSGLIYILGKGLRH